MEIEVNVKIFTILDPLHKRNCKTLRRFSAFQRNEASRSRVKNTTAGLFVQLRPVVPLPVVLSKLDDVVFHEVWALWFIK